MDLKTILQNLQKGIDTAQSIAGPLAAIGVPGAGLAKALLEVAENVKARIDEGAVVATSDDAAEVKLIIERLQTINDQLAAEIEES